MSNDQKKARLMEKLERCRRLARDFPDGMTAKNLKELEGELQAELRALEN